MKPIRRKKKCFVPLALGWSHCGVSYRVTAWPEVRFEQLYGEEWIAIDSVGEAFASAAQGLGPREWQPYLEFVPAAVRAFINGFAASRMEALEVAARCPALLVELAETPALASFLSSHVALRGAASPRWAEVNAVWERSGIYGVMEWLGLPASRQTLEILRHVVEPNLPKRFLEPLRSMLWEPRAIFALQRNPAITDRELANYCHALAA